MSASASSRVCRRPDANFLDANILFTAAHNPNGKAALVIELSRAGIWQLATSSYVAEEARRNIARKFPTFLDRLEALLGDIRQVSEGSGISGPAGLAEKDVPILGAALACRADISRRFYLAQPTCYSELHFEFELAVMQPMPGHAIENAYMRAIAKIGNAASSRL